MTELVRKGALAADRMSRNPDVAVACDDLARLADFGALAGVAEIVRERLRQVEQLGYSAEHDDRHDRGELVMAADSTLHASFADVAEGVAGYPECEEFYRQAGALLAAEMDRLIRMLTPEAGS
jgi:hypothetical protein